MPPISEAQRRLAHAAAAHKGGVGGMSQAVGREFSAADEPGKLPERKNRRSDRMYGHAKGGLVNAVAGRGGKGVKLSHATGGPVDETTNAIMRSEGERESMKPRAPFYRSGGKIAHVIGRPVGKDDGMIAAQRGEFVVRKSAVKKLGTAALDEINKGRLPSQRLYGGKRMVRHG